MKCQGAAVKAVVAEKLHIKSHQHLCIFERYKDVLPFQTLANADHINELPIFVITGSPGVCDPKLRDH